MVEEVCHWEAEKVLCRVQTRSRSFGQRSGINREPDCPGTGHQRDLAGTLESRVEGARPVGLWSSGNMAESFFALLKRERVNRRQYRTRSEARADIFDYIERFYNPRK